MSQSFDLPEELRIFLLESYEELDTVEEALIQIENSVPSDEEMRESLNNIFRVLHTIKGNSGFLGLTKLESLCHAGESLLARARTGGIKLDESHVSSILEMVDGIREMLGSVENSGVEGGFAVEPLIQKLAR